MTNADTTFVNGRLAGTTASAMAPASTFVDLGGALVVPGALKATPPRHQLPRRRIEAPSALHRRIRRCERVEFQTQNMANAAPIGVRARNQLELGISHGSTHMLSHVMVDASVDLKSLETLLAVREKCRTRVDIQLVASPQSSITA